MVCRFFSFSRAPLRMVEQHEIILPYKSSTGRYGCMHVPRFAHVAPAYEVGGHWPASPLNQKLPEAICCCTYCCSEHDIYIHSINTYTLITYIHMLYLATNKTHVLNVQTLYLPQLACFDRTVNEPVIYWPRRERPPRMNGGSVLFGNVRLVGYCCCEHTAAAAVAVVVPYMQRRNHKCSR